MSEQKYYVKLQQDVFVDSYLGWCSGYAWLDDEYDFMPKKFRHAFTLYELEKISQKKLARDCGYDDLSEISLVGNIVGYYWVNPLVELVPVKEE